VPSNIFRAQIAVNAEFSNKLSGLLESASVPLEFNFLRAFCRDLLTMRPLGNIFRLGFQLSQVGCVALNLPALWGAG